MADERELKKLSTTAARLYVAGQFPLDDEGEPMPRDPFEQEPEPADQGGRIGRLEQWRAAANERVSALERHAHRNANLIQALMAVDGEIAGELKLIRQEAGTCSASLGERLARLEDRFNARFQANEKDLLDLRTREVADLKTRDHERGKAIATIKRWYFMVIGGAAVLAFILDMMFRLGMLPKVALP